MYSRCNSLVDQWVSCSWQLPQEFLCWPFIIKCTRAPSNQGTVWHRLNIFIWTSHFLSWECLWFRWIGLIEWKSDKVCDLPTHFLIIHSLKSNVFLSSVDLGWKIKAESHLWAMMSSMVRRNYFILPDGANLYLIWRQRREWGQLEITLVRRHLTH